jgi:hypothetical protein
VKLRAGCQCSWESVAPDPMGWSYEEVNVMSGAKCGIAGQELDQGAEFCTKVRCFKCVNGTLEKSIDPERERDFVDWL